LKEEDCETSAICPLIWQPDALGTQQKYQADALPEIYWQKSAAIVTDETVYSLYHDRWNRHCSGGAIAE